MSVGVHTPRRSGTLGASDGFAMLIVIGVMFVASLLVVVAFTAANGDVHDSRINLAQKQAYYAAIAGVQEYQYALEANPNYWQSCPKPASTVAGETSESYEVTTLAAESDPEAAKTCNSANPFATIIESKGVLAKSFRIKSVGKSGSSKRAVIANFKVAGFLNYIYFTQYEVQDPAARNGTPKEQEECENYRTQREANEASGGASCGQIVFGPEDKENGPLHTDDTAAVCGGAEFGRAGHEPLDLIEMNGGAVSGGCGSGSAKYNTPTAGPITGPELIAPESDSSLKSYVEPEDEFSGRTKVVLAGSKIKVTTIVKKGEETTKEIEWPKNGLIYVHAAEAGCGYTEFEQTNTDTSSTYEKEESCGSVYVSGTFSKSLTVAGENDVIINGSITPTGVTPPGAPPGTAVVGLIATRFVRIYHPCSGGGNGAGSLSSPWIYAALLSTSHSFLVDNYSCGNQLGNLNIYGAIGQKFRGVVGTVGNSGYNKEYKYDERLATGEPPYYLAPLKAGWKIQRETATTRG